MKAKVAIAFGVIFLVFWIGFKLLRESPEEKYERMGEFGGIWGTSIIL